MMMHDLIGVGLVAVSLLAPHGIVKGNAATTGESSAEFSEGLVMGQLFGLGSGFLIYKMYLEY